MLGKKAEQPGKKESKILLLNVFEHFCTCPRHFLIIHRSVHFYKIFFAPFSCFLKAKRLFYFISFRQADKKLKWNTDDNSWAFVELDVRNEKNLLKITGLCFAESYYRGLNRKFSHLYQMER